MRLTVLMLFILKLSSVSGQSDVQRFIESKSYLLVGLSEVAEENNRTGIWKLSPATAVKYGLVVVDGYDERLDPVWSTRAAQLWYQSLYELLSDSTLADIAMIEGPSVAKRVAFNAMAYHRWEAKFSTWKSRASTASVLDLDAWSHNEEPVLGPVYWSDLDTVLDTREWSRVKAMNPSIKGDRLPSGATATIRLDSNINVITMERLWSLAELRDVEAAEELNRIRKRIENNIPDPSTHTRISYRVKPGDYLGVIANRYRVSLSDLKRWNSLHSDMIRVGQDLVIYVPRGIEVATVTPEEAAEQEGQVRADEEGRTEVQYRVKSGDTLWSISRNYPGISAEDIMRWNGINEDIQEGQMLMILVQNASQP